MSKRLPTPLSRAQVRAILAEAENDLDSALIHNLLYATGLRLAELLSTTLEDLDLEGGWLKVHGKGERERVVPIWPVAARLHAYIEARGITDHLLPGWYPRRVQRLIKSTARRAGVTGAHPHRWRHTAATHLYEETGDLYLVQTLLGHSGIQTTEIYAKVSPIRLREAMRLHPLVKDLLIEIPHHVEPRRVRSRHAPR